MTKQHHIPSNFRLYAPGESVSGNLSGGDWRVESVRVPPLGTQRGLVIRQLNKTYGFLTWRFAWKVAPDRCVPFRRAVALYEKSYEIHLRTHPEKLHYLVTEACDVFDNDESNVVSGVNYFIQGAKLTHLQDIAIRRVMQTLGQSFCGNRLIRVRKTRNADAIGRSLSPKFVTFCDPEIVQLFSPTDQHPVPTVEDFWQNNRVVQYSETLARLSPKDRQGYVECPDLFDHAGTCRDSVSPLS